MRKRIIELQLNNMAMGACTPTPGAALTLGHCPGDGIMAHAVHQRVFQESSEILDDADPALPLPAIFNTINIADAAQVGRATPGHT